MTSFLVHRKEADPGVAKGNPAEQAPLTGPKEAGRLLLRPWSHPNPKPNLAGAHRLQERCYEKTLV
jgi:hypothetical protein